MDSLGYFKSFLSSQPSNDNQPSSSKQVLIEPYNLKHSVLNGIPDSPSHLRPSIWRILLGLIPTDEPRNNWSALISNKRDDYNQLLNYFTHQLIIQHPPDHHLNYDRTLGLIDADVIRTQASLIFFNRVHSIDSNGFYGTKLKNLIEKLSSFNNHHRRPPIRGTNGSHQNPSQHLKITLNIPTGDQARSQSILPSSPLTPTLNVQAPSPTSPSPKAPNRIAYQEGQEDAEQEELLSFTYRDLLTRFLAVWSTLNPGIGYVQGMSQIGAVLIYVFSQSKPLRPSQKPRIQRRGTNEDDDGSDQEEEEPNQFERAEADAFWAFNSLISPIRDLFIKTFDRPSPNRTDASPPSLGFARVLCRYESQMASLEPALMKRFRSINLDTRDYLIDWLGCLFCNCYELPDLIRIWDSILAIKLDTSTHQRQRISEEEDSNQVLDYLVDLSCVMTLKVRQKFEFRELSKIEFEEVVRALQNFKNQTNVNVDQIIQESLLLRQRRLAEDLRNDRPSVGSEVNGREILHEDDRAGGLEDEPNWDQEGKDLGWEEYEGPQFGASITSLASKLRSSLKPQPQAPISGSSIIGNQGSTPDQDLQDGQPGLLTKLMSKAESWKDSDAAANISKKATNWKILASSWRPPLLVSELNNTRQNNNGNDRNSSGAAGVHETSRKVSPMDRGFQSPTFPQPLSLRNSIGSTYSSPTVTSRWSKTSNNSSFSGDSSGAQPPATSSSTTFSDQASSSSSSPSHGSPNRSHNINCSGGPKPLLLSSSVRTSVSTKPEPDGFVQQIIGTPIMKKLSEIGLGGNGPGSRTDDYDHEDRSSERTPRSGRYGSSRDRLSPQSILNGDNARLNRKLDYGSRSNGNSPGSHSVSILSGNRSRARSVLSSPNRSEKEGGIKKNGGIVNGSKRPERNSLPLLGDRLVEKLNIEELSAEER